MTTPFGTSLGRHADDRQQGLKARIDGVIHERLQQAIEAACLDTLIETRRRSGRSMPADDSAADRNEFQALIAELLELLEASILPAAEPEQRPRLVLPRRERPGRHASLMTTQVALAKLLPDYWQRFEACRAELTTRHAPLPAGGTADQRLQPR
jgi:hypothetical protein